MQVEEDPTGQGESAPGLRARSGGRNLRRPLAPWVPTLLLFASLYLFGPLPPERALVGNLTSDKIVHAAAFAGVTLAAFWLEKSTFLQNARVVAVIAGFAAGLEWLQGFVPGRDQSVGDIVANLCGIGVVATPWGIRQLMKRAS